MKTFLSTLLSFFVLSHLYAQKFELSIGANSGLFHYAGSSAVPTSAIYQGSTDQQNYTINPYGSKNGFSYGAAVQAQYVSKGGFITGLKAGYEVLRSKVTINSYYPLTYYFDFPGPNSPIAYNIPVTGQTFLQGQSINLNPYIGYRFTIGVIKLDLMPGIDLGFNINSYDKGKATDSGGNVYRTDLKLADTPTDVRVKFGVAAGYKRFWIIAAYTHGLPNLDKLVASGVSPSAHSELLSFGITYRIF
jgi:hypothetical protein